MMAKKTQNKSRRYIMGSEEEEDSNNNNSEKTVKFGMVPIGWRAHQRTHTLILLLLLTDFFSSGPR